MKRTCKCGRQFEVPDDAEVARCPACGKAVRASESQDWLQDVDMDSLSLEGGAPQPEAPEPEPAPKPRPAPAAGEGQSRPPEQGLAQAGAAAARRHTAPAAKLSAPPKPLESVLDLAKVFKDDPKAAAPQLREGVTSRRFLAEMGIGLVALSLLSTVLATWLFAPRGFAPGYAFMLWLRSLCEATVASLMLALLAVALKRGATPLGAAQGVVFARLVALAILLPLGVLLGAITLILLTGERVPSGFIGFTRMLPKIYLGIALVVQTFITMGLFNLGCGGGLVLSVVTVYGAVTMAGWLLGGA